MNTGDDLWKKAVQIIPGGNGLLSKRPERYAPGLWPTYYTSAKGVVVRDLDGREYIDMAQMGIGTAILGYSDSDVNAAVKAAVDDGVSTTLNAPEEVYLAERLLALNSFAGGVKFARTGGEAMAMAIRIARAYSGKDTVAFSGYHGWSDWYLAANLSGEGNLSDHLLPGLKPKGVPRGLQGTAVPFQYNNIDALRALVSRYDIGVIVLEGARYDFPTQEFLAAIQDIARAKNIVIVLDEITSGWRMTESGVYKLYNFTPDIVVYGKAMGNGFAISAVVGSKKVMDCAQETFISSTFWTERVGFVAALATISKLTRYKVWEHLISTGDAIGTAWQELAEQCGLRLHVTDFKPLITFKLEYDEMNSSLYTLFTQEMLKRGYLAANSVYVSFSHSPRIVNNYRGAVEEVFNIMADAVRSGTVADKLETPIRDEGFKRLN